MSYQNEPNVPRCIKRDNPEYVCLILSFEHLLDYRNGKEEELKEMEPEEKEKASEKSPTVSQHGERPSFCQYIPTQSPLIHSLRSYYKTFNEGYNFD